MTDKTEPVDNDMDAPTKHLIVGATNFMLNVRRAHWVEQPEIAARFADLVTKQGGTFGIRIELGLRSSIEAGVMHEGNWLPFFKCETPAETGTAH